MEKVILSQEKTIEASAVIITTQTRESFSEADLLNIVSQYSQRLLALKEQMKNLKAQYDETLALKNAYDSSLADLTKGQSNDMAIPT